MNLFVTSEDPVECAMVLDDKRVGKMLMEACQMMSLALKRHDPLAELDVRPDGLTAGTAYSNHPATLWVGENIANYIWTWKHANALAGEYFFRFEKHHASGNRLNVLWTQRDCLPAGVLLPFYNGARNLGLGADFTCYDPPRSYRSYLRFRWVNDKRPPVWTKRGQPSWAELSPQCE